MRHHSPTLRLLALVVFLTGSTAARADGLEDTYAQWKQLRDPDTVGIRFTQGALFLTDHPGWPEEKLIRLRTEAAALFEKPPHQVMEKFCADPPPLSGRGMVACAEAKVGTAQAQANWVHQGWIQGDFTEDEEQRILAAYGTPLKPADHQARLTRLLYESKLSAAKRMLPRVGESERRIATVRMAFIAGDKSAPRQLDKLSTRERHDAGILFERLRWRAAHDMDHQLAELLLAAPKEPPHADLWWPMRAIAVREAMGQRHYAQALALLAHHGNLKNEALAEALWLKGWLTLKYKHDAGAAYKQFYALYTSVYTPVSKARAAYWAGRAAEENGNHDIAVEWMQKAARHPTVFYGQLAHAWLTPQAPLNLPPTPTASDADRQAFEANELVRMTRKLAKSDDTKTRDLFLSTLAARARSETEFALTSQLATQVGGTASGVEVAKQALRNGVVLVEAGWPQLRLPEQVKIEDALALSITRQESQFDPAARSPANARGLMQLLPGTAKMVAQKLDMAFSEAALENPSTNLILGSHYLGQIVNGFDGSYILGIASYNAGPGSVRRWLASMGKPPKNLHGAIDWVESIPYGETRNYVMRVMENMNVYRALAKPDAPVSITNDLTRGS